MSVLKRHGPKGWVPATNGNIMHAGTMYHDELQNRDKPDQHPMEAITGLKAALENTQPKGDYATNTDLAEKQNKTKIVNVTITTGMEGTSDVSSEQIIKWIDGGEEIKCFVTIFGEKVSFEYIGYYNYPNGRVITAFVFDDIYSDSIQRYSLFILGTDATLKIDDYNPTSVSTASRIPPELPPETEPNVQAVLNALSSDKLSKTGHTPNKNLATDESGNVVEEDREIPSSSVGDVGKVLSVNRAGNPFWDDMREVPYSTPVDMNKILTVGLDGVPYWNKGGISGTSDYNDLTNKPQINGVELVGNKTTQELNIDIPTKLPNPNSITFTGGATGNYDGSTALEVHVPTTDEIINALPKWKWGAF